MPQNETNELLKQILGVLNEIKLTTLRPITSQVNSLFPLAQPLSSLSNLAAEPIKEKPKPVIQPPSPGQRAIVDKILTKDFGIEVEPMDGSKYKFTIVVPDKYSTVPPIQRSPKVRDIRPKVVHYADGDSALEQWTGLVYKSFPPDVQAIMAADR